MASGVPVLSEEQLLCPICLGLLVKPVSTPCGHNFCMSCLSSYWDSSPVCVCPVCKESFSLRPQLRVNTFISGLSQSFSSLQLSQAQVSGASGTSESSVLCDICTTPQQNALRSCVECLSSFCALHLEPHHRVLGLRRHTLVPPKAGLQERVCPQHQQLLLYFCPEEGALLCAACPSKHRSVPLEQAYSELRVLLQQNQAKVSSLVQQRVQKVCSIRDAQSQRQQETRQIISDSQQLLQDILNKVQKNHKDMVQSLEEQQQQDDSEAEALVTQAEQEIAELIQTQTKLQELKQTEDPFLFLKKHPNMSLVSVSDASALSLRESEELEQMRQSLKSCTSRIKVFLEKIDKEISSSEEKPSVLKRLQRYAVDFRLDPDTANPCLVLTPDRKQVWFSGHLKQMWLKQMRLNKGGAQAPENNGRRFLRSLVVIADRGFSSGRFYFEVSVGQKEKWLLGLIAESVPRDKIIPDEPNNGTWALHFRVDKFYTFNDQEVPVFRGKVERVGVFVDIDKGLVSFYDVNTATCIYTFNNCIFEEKMYPFLNPCDNFRVSSDSESMMIVDPK